MGNLGGHLVEPLKFLHMQIRNFSRLTFSEQMKV